MGGWSLREVALMTWWGPIEEGGPMALCRCVHGEISPYMRCFLGLRIGRINNALMWIRGFLCAASGERGTAIRDTGIGGFGLMCAGRGTRSCAAFC